MGEKQGRKKRIRGIKEKKSEREKERIIREEMRETGMEYVGRVWDRRRGENKEEAGEKKGNERGKDTREVGKERKRNGR